jgi:tRNA 2-thiouridine synthesizing protein D
VEANITSVVSAKPFQGKTLNSHFADYSLIDLVKFGIILTEGPYQTQRWETACHIAQAAVDRAHRATFFLFINGVYNALGTQVFPALDRLPMDSFKGLMARGVEIYACEVCTYNRGLDEGKDFYEGVKIVSVAFVARMVSECDKLIRL